MAADPKYIWDYLMKTIKNPYGVAGIMGNLFAESSLDTYCKTGGDKKINGLQYAEMVDKAENLYECTHDGVAFGLVQWCFWTRKEGLYSMAQSNGKSIGNLDIQLDYLILEMSECYKTVWNTVLNCASVSEATEIVMKKYEKPANTGDKALAKRVSKAVQYYEKYAEEKDIPKTLTKYVVTVADKVFIRCGNGKDYKDIGKINKTGTEYEWVATAENGWHAIRMKTKKQIGWISGEYTKIVEK